VYLQSLLILFLKKQKYTLYLQSWTRHTTVHKEPPSCFERMFPFLTIGTLLVSENSVTMVIVNPYCENQRAFRTNVNKTHNKNNSYCHSLLSLFPPPAVVQMRETYNPGSFSRPFFHFPLIMFKPLLNSVQSIISFTTIIQPSVDLSLFYPKMQLILTYISSAKD